MRAAVCRSYGDPSQVKVEEVDEPVAGDAEVVVEVAAAAANFPDVLFVADRYQLSIPVPFVPGSELAGTVVEVGAAVHDVACGDRVRATLMHGAFAEKVAIEADRVTPVPDDVDLADAAAFYVTHSTAYHALRSVASVAPRERLLILGAAGGVGSAAVRLGVALGAEVVAAARGRSKLEACSSLGAAMTIDYGEDGFRDALRDIVADGIDVVLDPVGGSVSEPALRSLRQGGRFVTVGFASREIPSIPLNLVLLKGVTIEGFEMLSFSQRHPDLVERDQRELEQLFATGAIRPLIGARFGLDDTSAALTALADRESIGKVLIVPEG